VYPQRTIFQNLPRGKGVGYSKSGQAVRCVGIKEAVALFDSPYNRESVDRGASNQPQFYVHRGSQASCRIVTIYALTVETIGNIPVHEYNQGKFAPFLSHKAGQFSVFSAYLERTCGEDKGIS
jgi:hypothetical protein